MLAGGESILRELSFLSLPESNLTNSSFTIFITCCPGVTDFMTNCPVAFTRIFSIRFFTTSSATSASNNEILTSRRALVTSCSVTIPFLVSFSKIVVKFFESVLNINYLKALLVKKT